MQQGLHRNAFDFETHFFYQAREGQRSIFDGIDGPLS